jgi:hypothetical protein
LSTLFFKGNTIKRKIIIWGFFKFWGRFVT